MFAWFTFHKTNSAASRFGSWLSIPIRKAKIKSPITLTIAMLTIVLAITAFVANASGWFAKPASTKMTGRKSQTQPTPSAVRIETELVTMRRNGFEPQEITRPADPFFLVVENRSGLKEVTLRLNRVAGNRLKEVNLPRGKLIWRDAFDLPPGSYVLTEANNPDWVCSITITAK